MSFNLKESSESGILVHPAGHKLRVQVEAAPAMLLTVSKTDFGDEKVDPPIY